MYCNMACTRVRACVRACVCVCCVYVYVRVSVVKREINNLSLSSLKWSVPDELLARLQITLFHDPNSAKPWNYLGSQLVCWLQSPTASFDQPVHGTVILFNERDGDLQPLSLHDLEALKKLVDAREKGAEQA